jgi:hypothetical protein
LETRGDGEEKKVAYTKRQWNKEYPIDESDPSIHRSILFIR